MKKTGLADSPFFQPSQVKNKPDTPPLADTTIEDKKPQKTKKAIKQPSNRDTTIPRYQDTMTPRVHGVAVELVRKAVKEFGKEAATHRFTQAEKKEIGDLIYTYRNQGVKTSENEITRIAVNYIIEDYKENGENSVLNKILEALNE
jgi:hypothetical protein